MNIEKIFEIGNDGKNISGRDDYALANTAFAVLLQKYFEDRESGLELEIETDDSDGMDVILAYYDIVVVRMGESSLCIPLPLLEPCVIATVVKRGKFVGRDVHCRNCRDGSAEEMSALWAELLAEVDRECLDEALANLRERDKISIPEIA
mgnify:CR=1 FL=1